MGIKCIWCGASDPPKSTAHIIPESLCAGWSLVAPPGTVCDKCNQYFGLKVESVALGSFPFLPLRVLLGVPNKKRRMPSMPSTAGRVSTGDFPGQLSVDWANERLARAYYEGQLKLLVIPAEVTEPVAVCRMLLKIALEVIGKNQYDSVISARFDSARKFARFPQRGAKWWFSLYSDPSMLTEYYADPSAFEWSVEIRERDGAAICVLAMPSTWAFVPLETSLLPPSPEEETDHLKRYFWAQV